MKPITITVTPARDAEGRRRYSSRGQLVDAAVLAGSHRASMHRRATPPDVEVLVGRNGRAVVQGSVMPLADAARALLTEGVPPATALVMRHAAGDHDALTTSVGDAARLAIEEGDRAPVLRRWRPSPHAAIESPSRENAGAATSPAAE